MAIGQEFQYPGYEESKTLDLSYFCLFSVTSQNGGTELEEGH